jgi:hypothetical protein
MMQERDRSRALQRPGNQRSDSVASLQAMAFTTLDRDAWHFLAASLILAGLERARPGTPQAAARAEGTAALREPASGEYRPQRA